jgi:hypothetical protein
MIFVGRSLTASYESTIGTFEIYGQVEKSYWRLVRDPPRIMVAGNQRGSDALKWSCGIGCLILEISDVAAWP